MEDLSAFDLIVVIILSIAACVAWVKGSIYYYLIKEDYQKATFNLAYFIALVVIIYAGFISRS